MFEDAECNKTINANENSGIVCNGRGIALNLDASSKENGTNINNKQMILEVDKPRGVRDNRCEVSVSHMMILNLNPEDSEENKSKNTIHNINDKLQQGGNFEELAIPFSEDKLSSSKGVLLNSFSSGYLISEEFENGPFSITKENTFSLLLQSEFV